MKILGQYGLDGKKKEFNPFMKPIEVNQFGDTLRDEDGMVLAVKDEYGDWVSPYLKKLGIKSVFKIEADITT